MRTYSDISNIVCLMQRAVSWRPVRASLKRESWVFQKMFLFQLPLPLPQGSFIHMSLSEPLRLSSLLALSSYRTPGLMTWWFAFQLLFPLLASPASYLFCYWFRISVQQDPDSSSSLSTRLWSQPKNALIPSLVSPPQTGADLSDSPLSVKSTNLQRQSHGCNLKSLKEV